LHKNYAQKIKYGLIVGIKISPDYDNEILKWHVNAETSSVIEKKIFM
jgi:hypothetical protein